MVSGSIAQAQKEPVLIRQHVMDQVVVSSEPDRDPALVEVLQTTVWRVTLDQYGDTQSRGFIAVGSKSTDGPVEHAHGGLAPSFGRPTSR